MEATAVSQREQRRGASKGETGEGVGKCGCVSGQIFEREGKESVTRCVRKRVWH